MGKLTGSKHGDAANELLAFYQNKVHELEGAGQCFMAAVALGLALETVLLGYILAAENQDGGELEVPDSVNLSELIEAANENEVLSAPIDIPSHIGPEGDETRPQHVAKDVVDKIRGFRNLIHPGRALKEGFDPKTFGPEQLGELKKIYESVLHSLLYYI